MVMAFLMYTFDRWEILRSLKNKENIFFTKKVIYDDRVLSIIILSFIRSAHDPIWNSWIFKNDKFFPKIKVLKNRKKTRLLEKRKKGKKNLMEKNLFLKIMIKYL